MENIIIIDETYYGNGEFEFIQSEFQRACLKSAHKAISTCELWDWLRLYIPPENKGFMWSSTPELDKINQELWKDPANICHSGSSYGMVMRIMEYIAKNGYDKYKYQCNNNEL
jgi:hypothetical protein